MNISAAEMEIMRIIWDLGRRVSTKELCDRLPGRKLTTVSTLAGRLIDKGVLRSEKIGRSHVHEYEALITEEEYQRMRTEEFVSNIYRGSAMRLVSALVKTDGLTKDDIAELRRLLDEKGE